MIFETGFDPLDQGDVFAEYIRYEIPMGLKGLMIAGALSAAMSSLSSSINAMASSTVIDEAVEELDVVVSEVVNFKGF